MIQLLQTLGLKPPPVFNGTVYTHTSEDIKPAIVRLSIDERRSALIDLLTESELLTASEIADSLGCSMTSVRADLSHFITRGVIDKVEHGANISTEYYLADKTFVFTSSKQKQKIFRNKTGESKALILASIRKGMNSPSLIKKETGLGKTSVHEHLMQLSKSGKIFATAQDQKTNIWAVV